MNFELTEMNVLLQLTHSFCSTMAEMMGSRHTSYTSYMTCMYMYMYMEQCAKCACTCMSCSWCTKCVCKYSRLDGLFHLLSANFYQPLLQSSVGEYKDNAIEKQTKESINPRRRERNGEREGEREREREKGRERGRERRLCRAHQHPSPPSSSLTAMPRPSAARSEPDKPKNRELTLLLNPVSIPRGTCNARGDSDDCVLCA